MDSNNAGLNNGNGGNRQFQPDQQNQQELNVGSDDEFYGQPQREGEFPDALDGVVYGNDPYFGANAGDDGQQRQHHLHRDQDRVQVHEGQDDQQQQGYAGDGHAGPGGGTEHFGGRAHVGKAGFFPRRFNNGAGTAGDVKDNSGQNHVWDGMRNDTGGVGTGGGMDVQAIGPGARAGAEQAPAYYGGGTAGTKDGDVPVSWNGGTTKPGEGAPTHTSAK